MANSGIADARRMLRARPKTPAAFAAEQARLLARWGVDAQVVSRPVEARIEHNRWLLDCDCGSGVAVNPDWSVAYCLGEDCGRAYTTIVIPEDRSLIEAELVKRPKHVNRNWFPGETVEQLEAERVEQERREREQRKGAVQP